MQKRYVKQKKTEKEYLQRSWIFQNYFSFDSYHIFVSFQCPRDFRIMLWCHWFIVLKLFYYTKYNLLHTVSSRNCRVRSFVCTVSIYGMGGFHIWKGNVWWTSSCCYLDASFILNNIQKLDAQHPNNANLIEGWWDTLRQQFLTSVARQMKQEVEGNLIISRLLLFDDRNNCTSLPCCDEHKRI